MSHFGVKFQSFFECLLDKNYFFCELTSSNRRLNILSSNLKKKVITFFSYKKCFVFVFSILRGIPTSVLHFHFLIQSFIPQLTELNWNQYEHNSDQSSFLLTSNGLLFTTTPGLLIYHTPAFLNDHLFPLLHRGQAMILVTTLALFSVLTGSHREC